MNAAERIAQLTAEQAAEVGKTLKRLRDEAG